MKLKFHNTEVHLDDDTPVFRPTGAGSWWVNDRCALVLDEPPDQGMQSEPGLHSILKYRKLLDVPGIAYTQELRGLAVEAVKIFDSTTGAAIGLILA
jgi:hypothetical protein